MIGVWELVDKYFLTLNGRIEDCLTQSNLFKPPFKNTSILILSGAAHPKPLTHRAVRRQIPYTQYFKIRSKLNWGTEGAGNQEPIVWPHCKTRHHSTNTL